MDTEHATKGGGELPQRLCPHGFPTTRSTVESELLGAVPVWYRDLPDERCRLCNGVSPFVDYKLPEAP